MCLNAAHHHLCSYYGQFIFGQNLSISTNVEWKLQRELPGEYAEKVYKENKWFHNLFQNERLRFLDMPTLSARRDCLNLKFTFKYYIDSITFGQVMLGWNDFLRELQVIR